MLAMVWKLYLARIWRSEEGQDLVEYALLASLAAVASGLFVPELSESMRTIYSMVASRLVAAGG
jgi:Flp pilus assembly pilin Flp